MPSERGGLRADQVLADVLSSTVGASPAGDGGLIADQSLADVPGFSIVGASLLAKAFCPAAGFFLTEYVSIPAATAT